MNRGKILCAYLDDLKTNEVLDVTGIGKELGCFKVKHVREILNAKYLIRNCKVIANTYAAISEAASLLQERLPDLLICLVNSDKTGIRLQRVKACAYASRSASCNARRSTNRTSKEQCEQSTRCATRVQRNVSNPTWLTRLIVSGKLSPTNTAMQDDHRMADVVLRYKDMPSIASIFNV